MARIELVVLGTASQVPTRYRNHNGYLLRWEAEGLLFDPGEGTQRQMTITGVAASSITRILVTHFHGDHCLGLPGIVQRLALDGVRHEVPVHYPASGQRFYERLRHASSFRDTARTVAEPIHAPGTVAEEPLHIETLPLDHPVDSWGYRISEPDRWSMVPSLLEERGISGPAVGRLRRDGRIRHGGSEVHIDDVAVPRRGSVVAFVMDTRWCENAVALARGADLVVCESTFSNDDADLADAHGHLTAAQAAGIAASAGARRLVLTHFSQRYPDVEPLVSQARVVHDDVIAASDGLVVEPPPREPRPT